MKTNIIIIISIYVLVGLLDIFDVNDPAILRFYIDT